MLAAMPAFVDHYEVLGVAPTASDLEIRQAYRRLVALDHADRHGGDPAAVERTRSLNLARDVLVDPDRRRQFDVQRGAAAFVRDPLLDTLARTFGAAPRAHAGSVPATPPPPPLWLRAAVVGIVGAATIVTIAAAAVRAARAQRVG
jgi:curved DNA-binding protein CbpA